MNSTVCKYGACWSGQDFFSALHAVQVGYGDWKCSAYTCLFIGPGQIWPLLVTSSSSWLQTTGRRQGAQFYLVSLQPHRCAFMNGYVWQALSKTSLRTWCMLSLWESFILVVCNWHSAFQFDCELEIPKDTTWVGKEFSRNVFTFTGWALLFPLCPQHGPHTFAQETVQTVQDAAEKHVKKTEDVPKCWLSASFGLTWVRFIAHVPIPAGDRQKTWKFRLYSQKLRIFCGHS